MSKKIIFLLVLFLFFISIFSSFIYAPCSDATSSWSCYTLTSICGWCNGQNACVSTCSAPGPTGCSVSFTIHVTSCGGYCSATPEFPSISGFAGIIVIVLSVGIVQFIYRRKKK